MSGFWDWWSTGGRDYFCGPASEPCLREWVSALGGYFAVIVAIPTIYYLARQIKIADAHHRESMVPAYRRSFSLAARVNRLLQDIGEKCLAVKAVAEDNRGYFELQDLRKTYTELCDLVGSADLSIFENEFGPPPNEDIASMQAQLRQGQIELVSYGHRYTDDAAVDQMPDLTRYLSLIAGFTQNYVAACLSISEAIMAEYAKLHGIPHSVPKT